MLPHAFVVATTVMTLPPPGCPDPAGVAPEEVLHAVSASIPADVAATAPTIEPVPSPR